MIQVSCVCEAPVSRARLGSATFNPATAETTAMRASPTTSRMSRRCPGEVTTGAAGVEGGWAMLVSSDTLFSGW